MAKKAQESHSSFAFFSPFVTSNPRDGSVPMMIDISGSNSSPKEGRSVTTAKNDDNSDSLRKLHIKLMHSRIIQSARELGLSRKVMNLQGFDKDGGSEVIARELVQLYFSRSKANLPDISERTADIQAFCKLSNVSLDHAIAQYADELCSRNVVDGHILTMAEDLVQLCTDPGVKCEITLKFLQAALLSPSKPNCLKYLAKEAVLWASNNEIRSEVEEATRLLGIDEIVRRYCGNKAAEIFRVSDSLHSMRLLNYVSRNIDSASIISDILFLCSAFTHLSAVDHCVTLMERVIIAKTSSVGSRAKQCSAILERIHDVDKRLSGTIAARVCVYCTEIMDECAFDEKLREKEKKKGELHLAACSAATALCYSMTKIEKESLGEMSINSHHSILFPMPQSSSWSSVRDEFQRIQSLFTEFGVCISLSQLRNRCNHDFVIKSLIIDALNQTNSEIENTEADLKMKLAKARRGCTLLYGENPLISTSNWCRAIGSIACKLVNSKREDKAIILLEASGLIDEISNDTTYQAIAMVSISLCSRASDDSASYVNMNDKTSERAMRCIILAASLLQEHALVFCPTTLLPLMIFLSNLVDVANQIILRADCGVGEDMDTYKQSLHEKTIMRQQPLIQSQERNEISDIGLQKVTPTLHPTWHVGDGLLLSPFEALARCMSYCRGLLSADNNTQDNYGQHEVHNFLAARGAHSISLRMLMCASVATSCKELPCENSVLHDIAQDIIFSMAERSLGGSGTGYTNARIDSHLAVSTILYLPIKVAFKAYERCLPSAMSGRDFERVIALANIGQRAAGATCEFEETLSATNCWKKQTNLLSQCKRLALKAYWWRVLKNFDVSFDPSAFDNVDKKESEKTILLLISDLIANSSRIIRSATTVQKLAADFAKAFELKSDLPIQKHIEFLLTWPENCHAKDLRHSLKSCEKAVKHLLGQLKSGLVRSSVLRRCLVAAEEKDNTGKDFERYSMLLSMYHRELHGIHGMKSNESSVHKFALEQEIERIDRRQDALAILSAYFRERKFDERPLFQKCFEPLPSDLNPSDANAEKNAVGVLGIIAENQKDMFDPLLPLVPYLKKDPSHATSALAPMCISLGLPSGFIHARALVHRILLAKDLNGSLPPFESEVYPTIKKLRIANDGTELAEWCSFQYDADSTQRFLCLNVALNLAIKASTFAEQALRTHRNFQNQTKMKEDEKKCLERVERLTLAKSSLSDIITVKRIIKDEIGADNLPVISTLLFKVVEKARIQNCSKNGMGGLTPEKLVEKLLVEGSLLTSELSLDPSIPFDRADFRRVCYIIHKACSTLEDQYSHIKIGYICRRLVRRWLLHGDETNGSEIEENSSQTFADTKNKRTIDMSQTDHSIDEDDTANLVLDLKTITSGNAAWMDDVGCDEPKKKKLKTIIADEEKSSIKANTRRESSEYLSARVGLRVAMVMFFAQDFHSEGENSDHPNEENLKPLDQVLPNQTTDMHARYLIKLVFAKTGLHSYKGETSAADSGSGRDGRSGLANISTNTRRVVRSEGKALTFAMRHRALRAASVLCPEGVLNTLILEENFFGEEKCSLAKCCFGSFLAKEIEEMGLPLPHSDLVQLSVMHHPSYARTLWRHHGRSGPDNLRGRLMLLMLELALRQKKIMDSSLVSSILNEILSLNIPRTNLLICECIARTDDIKDVFDKVGVEISQITKRLVSTIFQEITSLKSDVKQCINTLQRLGKIIVSFMKSGIYNNEVERLINSMHLSAQQCDKQIRGCLFEVAVAISCEVKDTTMKSILLKKSCNMADSEDSLQDRLATLLGNKANNIVGQNGFGGWDCFFKLTQKETGLAESFLIAGGI